MIGPALGFVAAFIANLILALMGHGGITVIGLNTLLLGSEAVLGHTIFYLFKKIPLFWRAVLATMLTLFITTMLLIGFVALSHLNPELLHFGEDHGRELEGNGSIATFAALVFTIGVIGWIIEAAITGAVVRFISQVKPDLLGHVAASLKKNEHDNEAPVMIDVARIDHWAASGSGAFHRASPVAKVVFVLLVVSAAVVSKNPYPLIAGYGALVIVAALSGLPWSRVMVLSWYAAVFAILYSLSLRGGFLIAGALHHEGDHAVLCRADAYREHALSEDIFPDQPVLPEIIAAGLFMTYRTLFILLDMMDNFAAAIRLRGGFSPGSLYKNSANISKGIGMLLVTGGRAGLAPLCGHGGARLQRQHGGAKARYGFQRADWLPLGTGTRC